MRTTGQALLAPFAALCLLCAVPGCEVIDKFGEESASETPSEPTPDQLAEAALAPKPARSYKAIGQGVICPGSFGRFKRRISKSSKDPGPGYEWHHIVNQNSTNVSEFGNRLHCTDNLIALPKELHHKVSGHFAEKPGWAKGEHVRDVINKRSWNKQYEYGLQVLRDKGIKP